MFLLIDNYDSFTYNLVHRLGELGAHIDVRRNDALSPEEALALEPEGIIISPGPCDPDRAGICLALIAAAAGKFPILGVCLGHQAIGQALGGKVVRAPVPMHGKVSDIHHQGTDIFRGLPNPFRATRYHSLVVAREGLPRSLMVTAETADGIVMGLKHRTLPIYGVQFHPESIETAEGYKLLANFLSASQSGKGKPAAARQGAAAA
ncbi:MAG TPA: aminodeoxychorismate/anthranilate synthase component II [Alphaproteobacteria bacterium]|nr:aminodeoxychorismate/anthranilate synthase component II [Alphaproteobacteria bacterium]